MPNIGDASQTDVGETGRHKNHRPAHLLLDTKPKHEQTNGDADRREEKQVQTRFGVEDTVVPLCTPSRVDIGQVAST